MNTTLRKLNTDDWEIYRDIRLEGLQSDPSAFGGAYSDESQRTEERWRQTLGREERTTLGIFVDGKISAVGTIGYWVDNQEYGISAIYTKKEFRGNGFSKQIIQELISIAKKMNESHVTLMVNTNNQIAIDFYKSLGFETKKVLHNQKLGDGNYYDEFYMIKNL